MSTPKFNKKLGNCVKNLYAIKMKKKKNFKNILLEHKKKKKKLKLSFLFSENFPQITSGEFFAFHDFPSKVSLEAAFNLFLFFYFFYFLTKIESTASKGFVFLGIKTSRIFVFFLLFFF